MNQNAGNIIRRSTVLGDFQQTLAALALFFAVNHLEEDFLLINNIAQTVGAKQQTVIFFNFLVEYITSDHRLGADGTGDEILAGVGFGLFRAHHGQPSAAPQSDPP